VERETRGYYRRAPIIGAGTAHGAPRAPDDFGFRGLAGFEVARNRTDAAHVFFEGFFGMAVGCIDGPRGCAQVMEMPQLVRGGGHSVLDGVAHGGLPVADDGQHWHVQGLFDLLQEGDQIVVGCGQHPVGQQDFAEETVAEDPQDFMTQVRLHPLESQEDMPLGLGEATEALGILERQRESCIIAIQEGGDRPWGHGNPVVDHGVMDCGETAVEGRAAVPHKGHDLETARVLGQGQAACSFRSIGFAKLWAGEVKAASNLQREAQHGLQGRHGTGVVGGGPHRVAAAGPVTQHREQGLRGRWSRTGCGTSHRDHLQVSGIPMVSVQLASSFSAVCYPSFFQRPRTRSRPSRTPVCWAKTVASARQLH
jgi:hypothetical protein